MPADLRQSNDEEPGYSRRRFGKGFAFYDAGGHKVEDEAIKKRLNALAVPPAYRNVWYCRDENGHIQATGYDEKGRKQYRYHDEYRLHAEADKFARTAEFGKALPKIRKRVAKDLRKRKLSRETVLAAVVRLLDTAHLRIGNRRYAKGNKSFGLTTLRVRHVERLKTRLKVNFRGKHGVKRDVTITEPALVRILSECQDLPGQELFQYLDDNGKRRTIDSADVNDYLRAISGTDFTAKKFRTWGASKLAMEEILAAKKERRPLSVANLIEPVAEALGNTPAVTRSSYIHPLLVEAVKAEPLDPLKGKKPVKRKRRGLSKAETQLLAFLDGDKKSMRRRLLNVLRVDRG
ncbi:DNA topoisomerase IB [Sphingomicrobium clamense]|uniref:DNA topoisomerase IB n=1 Tax=Sphingomicrobium clamense TaxID=2851013 RepID=A0ABS6V771_9SPHN|nr:DNA topoisomerase IB [Sphingomicrobium sp. B8]MBW0145423.1 DNA topoisomerase IB [Sphingomicrobium sp. B8]